MMSTCSLVKLVAVNRAAAAAQSRHDHYAGAPGFTSQKTVTPVQPPNASGCSTVPQLDQQCHLLLHVAPHMEQLESVLGPAWRWRRSCLLPPPASHAAVLLPPRLFTCSAAGQEA